MERITKPSPDTGCTRDTYRCHVCQISREATRHRAHLLVFKEHNELLRSGILLTGARAKAAIMSRAPPRSAARPTRYCWLLAYCSKILRSMLKRGSCRVASFCKALPTLFPAEAMMVKRIASHMSRSQGSCGKAASPMMTLAIYYNVTLVNSASVSSLRSSPDGASKL